VPHVPDLDKQPAAIGPCPRPPEVSSDPCSSVSSTSPKCASGALNISPTSPPCAGLVHLSANKAAVLTPPRPESFQTRGSHSICPPVALGDAVGLECAQDHTSGPVPLAGFRSSGLSPFHFGGMPPDPLTARADPSCPPPSDAPGQGLPMLATPCVAQRRGAWMRSLSRLAALPGANTALISDVRAWIATGVRTHFRDDTPPPPDCFSNTKSFRDNQDTCMERLRVYRDLGALVQLPSRPGGYPYVQPLHAVLRPDKKARVCVDLSRNFNDFVIDTPFRYSSVTDAVRLSVECPTAAHYVKLDISSCFLSFPLHPDDYQFFVVQADGDFFQFLSMVFGMKDAPRIATLLLDVVSAELHDAGIEHTRYLDDFFLVATTARRAWACAHRAAVIIKDFGLALSPDKVEGPLQRIEFLGIVIDSVAETLSISATRQSELCELLLQFRRRHWSSRRRLESLLGKLSFASTVLPGARPFTRRIIDTLTAVPRGRVRLDSAFQADVAYWLTHISTWNGRATWRRPSSVSPFVFASDASTSGFGYGLESCSSASLSQLPSHCVPGALRCGVWSGSAGDAARQQHSSAIQWGELFCVAAAAVEFGPLLRDSRVVFVIDNESDTFVLNRHRTRDPRLARLLRCICDVATRFNFSFSAVHRPGAQNFLMDWASRPELHHFQLDVTTAGSAAATAAQLAASSLSSSGRGGVVAGGGDSFPPLLHPTSIHFLNSRCLKFAASGSSATWTATCNGW
jgi:hypothetical protein